MRKRGSYYDRQGNQIDVLEWGRLYEDHEYRRIKQDLIREYYVSTVWIGINLGLSGDEIHIFETMTFSDDDEWEGYMERYATEAEAIAGHQVAVDYVNNLINESAKP